MLVAIGMLGAGACKDAGLPTSLELTDRLEKSIEQQSDGDLRRALGMILGALAFRRGIEGSRIDAPVDIETVLRVAQQLERRIEHPLADFVASWNSALERLAPGGDGVVFRRLIQHSHEMLQAALETPNDATQVKYLAGLARLRKPWIKDDPNVSPPVIFTLNYDRCLETALEYDGNWAYTTGFRQGLWTPTEFDDATRVRIYKLHGSFGWVRNPETSLLYDRDAALDREDIDFLSPDTPDELIFGTENKLQALQPYLWLVHQFAQATTTCKYIVVVGYGFGDEYINQIIGQAMATDPSKRLIVVTPKFRPDRLEHASGLLFYPERTTALENSAKDALHERDTVIACLDSLEGQVGGDSPF
jgi:hypothetical protein